MSKLKNPFIFGASIGLVALVVFLILHAIKNKPPVLFEGIVVAASCVGFVAALD